MGQFFGKTFDRGPFVLFSFQHLVGIAASILVNLLVFFWTSDERMRSENLPLEPGGGLDRRRDGPVPDSPFVCVHFIGASSDIVYQQDG